MNSRESATRKKRAAGDRPLIRCVIFDLDDTLYDCLGQRVRPAHRHAAEAMVKARLKASVDTIYRARMQAFRQDPTLRHIDAEVCRRFHADDPEAISAAARDAYFHCPVGKLKLFAGSLPLLRFLHQRGVRNFIVSFGEPATQKAKIKALGLDAEPSLEAIWYADRSNLLPAGQMLVVGDRPMSEIRAGRELGMHTVRVHCGEFASQMPSTSAETPDFVVRNIADVQKLPFCFGPQ